MTSSWDWIDSFVPFTINNNRGVWIYQWPQCVRNVEMTTTLIDQFNQLKMQSSTVTTRSKIEHAMLYYTTTKELHVDIYIGFCNHNRHCLTLNVRGPSYLGLTRSISWLLMPWLLTSPGHQQPWHWLWKRGRFLSYLKRDLNNLRRINVEKWHKMYIYMFMFLLKNLARKGF